jgi:mycothiol synthase
MDPQPPPGYVFRAATLADAGPLADLFNATTIAEAGVAWTDETEIRRELASPGTDLDNDVVLVHEENGGLVAGLILYADGPPVRDSLALGLVHPESWGRGLGTFVTLLGEERARRKLPLAPPTGRVTVHGSRFVQNDAAGRLFGDLGYRNVRTWWRMTIDLTDDAAPEPPDGIELRPFDPARDSRAVYTSLDEAFRDHWGEGMHSYEDWAAGVADEPGFVLTAVDGAEIAGVLVARAATGADPDAGLIGELGVRRPWRKRGLGLFLLRTAFAELRRLGRTRAVLNVDAESPTGATRLYERAGMRVELAWDRWEKVLRPS